MATKDHLLSRNQVLGIIVHRSMLNAKERRVLSYSRSTRIFLLYERGRRLLRCDSFSTELWDAWLGDAPKCGHSNNPVSEGETTCVFCGEKL